MAGPASTSHETWLAVGAPLRADASPAVAHRPVRRSAGDAWRTYGFDVGMPMMAPGHALSEVELLKWLNAYQWDAIARTLGRSTSAIVNDAGERLYPSLVDVELGFGAGHGLHCFGEGTGVRVTNRIGFFADRFVEGLFLLDAGAAVDAGRVATRTDLRDVDGAWAAMTNVFIARAGSNAKLKVFAPAGIADADAVVLAEQPEGMAAQRRAQATGQMGLVASHPDAVPLPARSRERIPYRIVPESDLNGAGLLYFARFVAIMNYGERRFLQHALEVPVSLPLALALSTEHRRVFYFANAEPTDTVEVAVSARVLPPAETSGGAGRLRTPFRLHVRLDLVRGSDKVLMASSEVRKALRVPADAKDVLLEAERFLHAVA